MVLRSDAAARAVLISLQPGQALGDHQVKERALVSVVDGSVRVEAGNETIDADAGCFFSFDADERRSISTESGARILLVLAPWPGEGHYRGDAREGLARLRSVAPREALLEHAVGQRVGEVAERDEEGDQKDRRKDLLHERLHSG